MTNSAHMKTQYLFLLCFSTCLNTFAQDVKNDCIVYHIPYSVRNIFDEEMKHNRSIGKNSQYSYYVYLFDYGDTVKLVLSKYDKRNPDAISRKIVLKSNRYVKMNEINLPILLQSDIKMSDAAIKIDGDTLRHETLFIPKGLQVDYMITDQGLCKILLKRYVE